MKKFLIITLIAVLAAPLGLEAQRKSGSRSSSSKSTSVRSSSSRKSSSSSARSVRSTPSVKRSSSAVRSTPRSSSSRSKSFATPRSSSSSSRSVVRTKPGSSSRSTSVTRSTSHKNVTTRSYATRESDVRTAPSAAERRTITNRATVEKNRSNNSRNINSVAPRSNDVYHSSRRFVSKRLPRYRYRVVPHPRDYRARIYPYRSPAYFHIYWSYNVFRHYCALYPVIEYWSYTPDYSISTISAYDALFHVGEIRRIYGKVSEVYYAKETDEFFLYFGAYYPYHDFTTVIPGVIARKFSRHPEFYFQDEHVEVTGLITEFEDKPEVVVKDRDQLRRY